MKKEIVFMGELNDRNVQNLIQQIQENPLSQIYFSSGGGFLYNGFALYDIFRKYKSNVIAIGEVASSALLAFLGAEKRYCFENTFFMYHLVEHEIVNSDIKLFNMILENDKRLFLRSKEIILKRTKIDEEIIKNVEDCREILFWNAQEARSFKIVDEILGVEDET